MTAHATIVRAQVLHTPRSPFEHAGSLELGDALAFAGGRVLAVGGFDELRRAHPGAELVDAGDAFVFPGFVDSHVHWPQLGVVGAMGLELLDWLRLRTLPEEARLVDPDYARPLAQDFLRVLAANGTTTALVFGSHFPEAQDIFFAAAERSGLRIASGLAVSDRDLLSELRRTPQQAYDAGRELAARWHGRGRLRYAVTPRFSLSCTEEMLESCGALNRELASALVTSHVNENVDEVRAVADRFREAAHYLDTYDCHGLVGSATVLAHNVHVTDPELARMAAAGTCAASCPSSNAFLGSGIFPMRRHLDHGVRFALGTDIGAGTSLSMLSEGLLGYKTQMLAPDGVRMSPAHLLWLATRAGAEVLGLGDEVGDLGPGKSADFSVVRPRHDSTLAAALSRCRSAEERLGVIFALAREDSVAEVRVEGEPIYTRGR